MGSKEDQPRPEGSPVSIMTRLAIVRHGNYTDGRLNTEGVAQMKAIAES
jgi:hypothetical protein